jgi:hypothetical protein
MKKNTKYKLFTSAILLLTTVIFVLYDNEIIFPAALVGFFLVLSLIGSENLSDNMTGKAANYAIITFSVIVIVLNILVTIFLPMISASTDLSRVSVELTTSLGTTNVAEVKDHFISVTINDIHELCYTTALLLLFKIIFFIIFKRKKIKKNLLADIS